MNESEIEAIEDVFDRISHTTMDDYYSLIKELSGENWDATTETMISDRHSSLVWMEGFCVGLQWVLDNLDGVRVV